MNRSISSSLEHQVMAVLRNILRGESVSASAAARWHTVMVSSNVYYLPEGVRAIRIVEGTAWVAYKLTNFTMAQNEVMRIDPQARPVGITSFSDTTVVMQICC